MMFKFLPFTNFSDSLVKNMYLLIILFTCIGNNTSFLLQGNLVYVDDKLLNETDLEPSVKKLTF